MRFHCDDGLVVLRMRKWSGGGAVQLRTSEGTCPRDCFKALS